MGFSIEIIQYKPPYFFFVWSTLWNVYGSLLFLSRIHAFINLCVTFLHYNVDLPISLVVGCYHTLWTILSFSRNINSQILFLKSWGIYERTLLLSIDAVLMAPQWLLWWSHPNYKVLQSSSVFLFCGGWWYLYDSSQLPFRIPILTLSEFIKLWSG